MKYSIIIPTLNEEKLLPGLLLQLNDPELKKLYDYEIIISDGGSSDKTLEIALEYSDIVKVHVNPVKQNIAMGRNTGAEYASGSVLIFINGDVAIPDIRYFFEFIERKFLSSSYAAMTCRVLVFPGEEKLSDKIFHFFYNKYFQLLNIFGIGMGRGECQVIKKEFFRLVKGNNEKLEAGEDFDLFKRINKHGKILFSNELYVYESPRRYRKLGYDGVTWSWIKNAISILLRNKSLSKEWEQVR